MAPKLLSRAAAGDDNNGHGTLTPVYIGGIVFACAIVAAVAAWLVIRYFKERANQESNQRVNAFLNVKGIVAEKEMCVLPSYLLFQKIYSE